MSVLGKQSTYFGFFTFLSVLLLLVITSISITARPHALFFWASALLFDFRLVLLTVPRSQNGLL